MFSANFQRYNQYYSIGNIMNSYVCCDFTRLVMVSGIVVSIAAFPDGSF
jgi:hypothetical protein